jgi:hypothetical protein
LTPSAVTGSFTRFIAGEPMNPATKAFSGLSYNSLGAANCCSFPKRNTATRSPIVMASTWSWVT